MTKAVIASMAVAVLSAGSMQASAALSHQYGNRVVRHSHVIPKPDERDSSRLSGSAHRRGRAFALADLDDRFRSSRSGITHHNLAALRAAVPERPTVFPSARPQPYPYDFHETDGLSRNPNDCVVWGCIDSN